jgi:hypothetical protein
MQSVTMSAALTLKAERLFGSKRAERSQPGEILSAIDTGEGILGAAAIRDVTARAPGEGS